MTRPFNTYQLCIVCRRRSSGVAVGKPDKLGWFCNECASERAKEITAMPDKKFDAIEKRAIQRVADKIGADLDCPQSELPQLIEWLISDFGEALKAEIDPPY